MSFRSIDIDALDEDQLAERELFEFSKGGAVEKTPEEANSAVQSKGTEVRNLLQRGNIASALSIAIDDPPYGLNKEHAKDQNTKIVMEVLNSTKAADIPGLLKSLSNTQQDTLMKYIYRGMTNPETFPSAVLLNWHEKLTEVAGVGCIVRVITDRKTV
ncbi:hypothetical protein G9A89_013611 [Geosiphon pyriformis]|nr:hypothetical protein G9A89_013611 [Geosiphon pyriformis]